MLSVSNEGGNNIKQITNIRKAVRAVGVKFGSIQERLNFLKNFRLPIKRKTVIGYVPTGLARELAKATDAGAQVKVKPEPTKRGITTMKCGQKATPPLKIEGQES